MSDLISIGMIVAGMGLCWLYAVALHRNVTEDAEVKS
jgi:hypothetical protein